jgi:hypothetical protein
MVAQFRLPDYFAWGGAISRPKKLILTPEKQKENVSPSQD